MRIGFTKAIKVGKSTIENPQNQYINGLIAENTK